MVFLTLFLCFGTLKQTVLKNSCSDSKFYCLSVATDASVFLYKEKRIRR